jgi:hypothetical protein
LEKSKIATFTEPPGQHGPNTAAVEFLGLAGVTLHGHEWIVPLAAEVGVSPEEVRAWLQGETPLTMQAPIWPEVIKALRGRQEQLGRLLDETVAAVQAAHDNAGKGEGPKAGDQPVKPLHILR